MYSPRRDRRRRRRHRRHHRRRRRGRRGGRGRRHCHRLHRRRYVRIIIIHNEIIFCHFPFFSGYKFKTKEKERKSMKKSKAAPIRY